MKVKQIFVVEPSTNKVLANKDKTMIFRNHVFSSNENIEDYIEISEDEAIELEDKIKRKQLNWGDRQEGDPYLKL